MYKYIDWYISMYKWHSICHVIECLVDMLISYMYGCTCGYAYLNICTYMSPYVKLFTPCEIDLHLVLVRIKGLKKWPKKPGNTLYNPLLKSQYEIFAADVTKKNRWSFAGVTEINDVHLQLIFVGNADNLITRTNGNLSCKTPRSQKGSLRVEGSAWRSRRMWKRDERPTQRQMCTFN